MTLCITNAVINDGFAFQNSSKRIQNISTRQPQYIMSDKQEVAVNLNEEAKEKVGLLLEEARAKMS